MVETRFGVLSQAPHGGFFVAVLQKLLGLVFGIWVLEGCCWLLIMRNLSSPSIEGFCLATGYVIYMLTKNEDLSL